MDLVDFLGLWSFKHKIIKKTLFEDFTALLKYPLVTRGPVIQSLTQ